jgi:hypothetical protein
MLFDPGTDTLGSSWRGNGAQETRGFLHVLDLTRINRMLRPIKAKIAAIQMDIRTHPSLGFALESTNVSELKGSEGRALRNRPQRTDKLANNDQSNITPSGSSVSGQGNNAITVSATGTNAATDVLLKRFQASFTDQFQDVVDKVWWRPFCDDYDLSPNCSVGSLREKGLKPISGTLAILSAFAVGRIVARLSEDEADVAEKYYHIMPAYMRR